MRERIRKLRRTLDLTQKGFADRLGITRGTITNYEIGRNEPVASVISLICKEFNVSEKWLRTGEGEMFLPKPKNELEALTKRYDLTAVDKILLEKYIKLDPNARQTIIDFILNVSREIDSVTEKSKNISLNDIFSEIPDTPEELEKQFPPVQMNEKKLG